jgi:hypothetical protein
VSTTPLSGDAKTLTQILEDHPTLWWGGWWTPQLEQQSPPGTSGRRRRETVSESGLAQFRRALTFLEVAPRNKSINRRHVTYGWKHCAERWARANSEGNYETYYVGEGSFIAACIASGMLIKREERGTYTNLATAAWSLGEYRA